MTDRDREAARKWLREYHIEDTDANTHRSADLAKLLGRIRDGGRREGIEEAAAWLAGVATKLREDAKTIPLGARSARRTFLEKCPAYDTENYIADIIEGHASSVRSLLGPTEERGDADNAR